MGAQPLSRSTMLPSVCLVLIAMMNSSVGTSTHSERVGELESSVLDGLKPLRFGANGELKILVFTDLHYGEPFPEQDVKSDAFQRKLLALEKPDFVVYNGDMSTNYNAPKECQEVTKNCTDWWLGNWRRWTRPMIETRTPYGLNMGNHDPIGEGIRPNGRDILQMDRWNRPISHSRVSPEGVSRASNYFIPIFPPEGNYPIGAVWILDSGADGCLGKSGWGCVLPDQVRWFTKEARRLAMVARRHGHTQSLFGHVFIHIPIEEALLMWNRAVTTRNPGLNSLVGNRVDPVDCSAMNTGVWAAIQDLRAHGVDINGVWHGHDHNNDFAGEWSLGTGAKVGHARKSGYGGYGGSIADHPGARVIQMKLAGEMSDPPATGVQWTTYIRLETGDIIHQSLANVTNDTVQAECRHFPAAEPRPA